MRKTICPARPVSAVLFVTLLTLIPFENARAVGILWQGVDLANYNTASNWSSLDPPNSCCDEVGTINNNTTAMLSAAAAHDSNGLVLGTTATDIGGLRIANLGSLTTVPFSGGSNGAITVGQAGQGKLTILGGGSLSGSSLALGGVTGSFITLGDNSGLTATLSVSGIASLTRTTTVHGPSVNFSATGNLTLSSASTLNAEITSSSTHSPLKSAGTASVAGTLKPTFTGVTPAAGNSWNLIDAVAITGGFTTVDLSGAPALAAGQSYQVSQVNGGTNGKLLKLSIDEILVLQVNRNSGAVAIANIGASPKALEGYSVLSSRGTLKLSNWNSLQDQALTGWVEAGGTVNDFSELNPTSSSTINASNSLQLGTPYAGQPGVQFPAFGVDPDDISFEYSTSDHRTIQGSVIYSGTKVNNNLIVSVNPATGQAQLKNDSPYSVTLDGYAVYSQSNSLQPANGKWFSLQDRGVTGWEEAQPTAGVVSELKENGSLTLSPFSGYDLGELYKSVGGTQDLRMEFFQSGQDLPTNGAVVYGTFGSVSPPGLTGDYNNNGIVDAADYVIWRKASNTNAVLPNDPLGGTIGQAQFNQWRANFGKTLSGSGSGSGLGIEAVPEPAAAVLLIVGILLAAVPRRSRISK